MTIISRLRHGVQSVGSQYPGPGPVRPSQIPGHDGYPDRPFDPNHVPPDVEQLNSEARSMNRSRLMQRGPEKSGAPMVAPLGVRLVPLVAITGPTGVHQGMNRSVLINALPYNKHRRYLLITNNDQSGTVIYFCFCGSNPFQLMTVPPGAFWESSSCIVTEEMWICDSAGNSTLGFYEGIIDPQAAES